MLVVTTILVINIREAATESCSGKKRCSAKLRKMLQKYMRTYSKILSVINNNWKKYLLDNFWKFVNNLSLISVTIYQHSPNYLHWVFFIKILFIRNTGVKKAKKKNYLGIMLRLTFKNSFHRSSHQLCSLKKGFLKSFAKFTAKHLRQGVFFNKVAGLLQLH